MKKKLIYKRCGCEVRPLQIGGAHTCAYAPNSGRARCVRATPPKTVATHPLVISDEHKDNFFEVIWLKKVEDIWQNCPESIRQK